MNRKVNLEKTLKLYRLYLWLNIVFYGLVMFIGGFSMALPNVQELREDFRPVRGLLYTGGSILVVLGAVFGIATAILLGADVRKRNWVYHYVFICAGISSIVLTIPGIVLARRWNSDEVKSYFNSTSFEL